MFSILRSHMKKIFWVLVILIVPAFSLWGIGGFMKDESRKPAGMMYGKKITVGKFANVRSACMLNALILYGKRYNDLAQYLDFNKQAWDRMLLLEEAKRLGIVISNDELAMQLRKLFSVNDEFSGERYDAFIKGTGVHPLTLEQNVKDTLAIGRLTRTIADSAVVSEKEVDEALERINEKRGIDYVVLNDSTYKKDDIYASDDELKKYYQENNWEFRVPEKVKAAYVLIALDQYKKKVTMSDKEVKEFYELNREIFKDEKDGKIPPFEKIKNEIKTRLIDQKVMDLAFEKATDISIALLHNPDLKAAAKDNSLEVKETAYFAQEENLPGIDSSSEFALAAFETPVGKISNAVKTPKGFYIINTIERKASYIPPLADIKDKAAAKVRERKSGELLRQNAEKIASEIKEKVRNGKLSFVQAAKSLGIDVKKAEPFKMTDPTEGIPAKAKEAAFTLFIGEISLPLKTEGGFVILHVDKIDKPQLEKLKAERGKIREELLNIKKDKVISQWYRTLRQKARLVDLTKNVKAESAD